MGKALFYKEWIKTRRSVALVAAIMAGFIIYAFIGTAQDFRVSGAVNVWNGVITKDISLLPAFTQWLPGLVGVFLAVSQFVPEMTDKRLKLTLHLPAGEDKILSSILAYGITVLATIFILSYAVLILGFAFYYPWEIISGMLWKSLPWFIFGLCSYILTAWVCVEPVWRQKIFNGIAAVCFGYFFFVGAPSGAYTPMIPYLVVFALVCFSFPFYSAARFKEGAQ